MNTNIKDNEKEKTIELIKTYRSLVRNILKEHHTKSINKNELLNLVDDVKIKFSKEIESYNNNLLIHSSE